jgi:chemotaxis protein MotB
MSDEDDDCQCEECIPGLPAWMGTFADLMSLLMCFFVLLLSFSEMDAMKFKRLAGSMAQAFGVQAKLKVKEVPKGTSIIAREFSPGRPDPTPINVIYQYTNDLSEMTLEVDCAEEYDLEQGQEDLDAGVKTEIAKKLEDLIEETEKDAMALAKALQSQIAQGQVEVETNGRQIIIRIREKGSFSSGSAYLTDSYIPVLHEVRDVLLDMPGVVSIQGHSDNIPIKTARFRSNWELSSSRAVSVAHELLSGGIIDPMRVSIGGYAETRPLVPNDTAENRARNRRVEIVIQQPLDKEAQEGIETLRAEDPELLKSLDLGPIPQFDLAPDEIF